MVQVSPPMRAPPPAAPHTGGAVCAHRRKPPTAFKHAEHARQRASTDHTAPSQTGTPVPMCSARDPRRSWRSQPVHQSPCCQEPAAPRTSSAQASQPAPPQLLASVQQPATRSLRGQRSKQRLELPPPGQLHALSCDQRGRPPHLTKLPPPQPTQAKSHACHAAHARHTPALPTQHLRPRRAQHTQCQLPANLPRHPGAAEARVCSMA